jgi:Tol biopolymer transport system component
MNPERWQRIKEVLDTALELESGRRDAYLNEACEGDPGLRDEVVSLMASLDEAGDFLDESPLAAIAEEETGDPLLGRRVGTYRITEEIGHGGMGTVYRALRVDDTFRKEVAIKIIRRGLTTDLLRRFKHERQILATLDHPNIARLLDGGTTDDGLPYFVMDFISGQPIDEYCDAHRLSTTERLHLFRKVCSAVQSAHEALIIHRDIKPGNILIDSHGEPKLLDFGIAKILDPELSTQTLDPTATILRLMTPEYASPEQVRGEPVTQATDIYSLGVLLYELLTGRRPYRLRSRAPFEIAEIICESLPDRPSTAVARTEVVTRRNEKSATITPEVVSEARRTRPEELRRTLCGDLDNIVLMSMRKEPHRRHSSVAHLSDDIQKYLDGGPVSARRDTTLYRVSKTLQRNKPAVLAATLTLAGAFILMAAWNRWLGSEPKPPPTRTYALTTLAGDENQPAFSPDGNTVAFVWTPENQVTSDIWVKNIATGAMLRLTEDAAEDVSPVFSPDGDRIAFLRIRDDETAIYISPASGGVHARVAAVYPTRIEAVGRHLDWSPDGKYLAAADKSEPGDPFSIVLIEAGTGHKVRLTEPPPGTVGDSNPGFSPDGQYVSFIRGLSSGVDDIHIVPIGGGPVQRLTNDRRFIISQTWSADGKWIVFSSNRGGSHTLWRVPMHGGAPVRLPAVGQNASDPTFSRHGNRLAYSQFFSDSNIWRVETSGGAPHRLIESTQYDSSPQYSPDGKKIAFRSSRSGNHEIWVSDSEGKNAVQISHFKNTLTGTPRWSPDSKFIVCDSRPDGQPDIYVFPAEGGPFRRITSEAAEDVVPSWSRDGKWIYFASMRGGSWQVWKSPAEGGAAQQVTRSGGFAAFESPDGEWLYYAKGRGVRGLWRMPTAGGTETEVIANFKPGYWGYWAITSDGIYFIDRPAGAAPGLFFMSLRTKNIRRIVTVDKKLVLADSAFAVSPDGRYALFSQMDHSGSDILIAENY